MDELEKLREAETKAFQFQSGELKNITQDEVDEQKRKFEVIATSGGLIENHWYWGNLIFDLDNIKFAKKKIPALLEHDTQQRVGYGTTFSVSSSEGLIVAGTFLKNKFGKEVSEDADDDFPWEISGYFEPDAVETVTENTIVNGKKIQASKATPLTIFKNITIKEVSFCTFGADSDTSAKVFKKQSQKNSTFKEKTMTELELANQRIAELEKQAKADNDAKVASDAELEKFKEAARDSDIKLAEKEKGITFDDNQLKKFKSMNDEDFKFALSLINPAQTTNADSTQREINPALFTQQADNGKNTTTVDDALDNKFSEWSEK